MYATNGKNKKVGSVKVDSLKIKGPRQDSDFGNKIPQTESPVKRYSLSALHPLAKATTNGRFFCVVCELFGRTVRNKMELS